LPEDARDARKASADLVAWLAFVRWSDAPWIVRRRSAQPAHFGCSSLNRAAPTGASPGSASASAACHEADLSLRSLHPPPGCRVESDQSPTPPPIASTVNSTRPTGSVGSWIDPPRLSLTFLFVNSSRMSRASANRSQSQSRLALHEPVVGFAFRVSYPYESPRAREGAVAVGSVHEYLTEVRARAPDTGRRS
jgi:hypothetical protein